MNSSGFLRGDALLKNTLALPNGAATVSSTGVEIQNSVHGDFIAHCELTITVPAVVVGNLADAATLKWSLEHDDAPGFGTVATLQADVIVQTGAGGAGAAGVTKRYRLPTNVKKYVRLKGVKSGTGDASGTSATIVLNC